MTRQRQIILEELAAAGSHPTADEIYVRVRRRLPRISLGTVYRNLEVLSERALIQKLELGGSQRRFDGNVDRHYHIRCIRCGRVDDAPVRPLTAIENEVRAMSDYKIIGHRLEFIGLCYECRVQDEDAEPGAHDRAGSTDAQR